MKAMATALALAVGLAGFAGSASAAQIARGSRVVVIPFHTLNVPAEQQWIGKALQETLMADLGREYSAVAFEGQTIVEDNATAARVARDASALYAVRGSAHVVNGEVRLTAQMIDAKTGEPVNTAIATGPLDKLLTLEDDVANQLRGVQAGLLTPVAPAPPVAPRPPLAPAFSSQQITTYTPTRITEPEVYPPAPFNDISLSAQSYNNTYPGDYGYPGYAYPVYTSPIYYSPVYSGYSYPSYGGLYFNIGYGRHWGHRGHHHGHHHGGWHHGGHHGGWHHGGHHGGWHRGSGWNSGWNRGGHWGGGSWNRGGAVIGGGGWNRGHGGTTIGGGGFNRGGGGFISVGGNRGGFGGGARGGFGGGRGHR